MSLFIHKYASLSVRNAGQVGFMFCNVRSASEATLGSTVHRAKDEITPLTSFPPAHPMVYAGLYPIDQSQFQALRIALEKLLINDSGVTMETETRLVILLLNLWSCFFCCRFHLQIWFILVLLLVRVSVWDF